MAHYRLQSNVKDIKKEPQVIGGFLKEKLPQEKQEVPDFPFVIVRFQEEDDNDDNVVTIRIMAGTYSEDHQNGWRDPMNILIHIKQALKKHQTFGAFSLEKGIKTEQPEEHPYPHWLAWMTLKFSAPQIQPKGDDL